MVKLSTLQRKGLLTLSLIQSARFVAPAADAVAYWKTYPKFSERFAGTSGGRFGDGSSVNNNDDSPFAKAARRATAREVAQCAESSDGGEGFCKPGTSRPSPPPARLYPRSRLAKRVGTQITEGDWREYEDCARERCPSCLDTVPRGGHLHHSSGASAAAEAAASVAAAATPFDLPLNLWKVLFQVVLTTLNVLCWLIPLKSDKISENKLALSLANAFSGGVFLSLAFGHLIPECVHGFPAGEYNEALPYMLVLSGYLLIFFVEKVAFDAHGLMHAGEEGHDAHGHHTHGKESKVANGKIDSEESEGLGTGRSAVILLGALAVHSVLEMTALGLANTFGESALLSLSIALHQPAESIALLVAFLKSGMPKSEIMKYLSIFSAMGPCGVALGMAVQEFAAPIVDAVMLAVVAGTFVYVGATEVIPEEWEEPDHKWKKFAALMMGIGSVFAITQYTMTLEA
mmetsp:Transcript_46413/g.140559  ORF Transcript_46413/g.140559 Transcript_46413/m.140559 type:complete len:459 (-) Transcript_46413:390-1766(-)|eukprot:CAMPEP_0113564024 /NCGR_PEP_ID=MMETSP0015_2-20120614/21384_1 /TAXON_ID=2838 /ORGANISM="Odontella" /LENGTH=458 /DNA_ID=CAMNT_0000466049 /DNA_START=226 /DNA_END=1602 /DNA_ORIENTATION=- /assembly_acc=CAM_ASM_000160